LFFLDDDMKADPAMLAEHQSSHREGADLVLGHIPLDPSSPPTAIALATARWAERRRDRLSKPGADIPLRDLLTGQLSLARATFERLGGFDASFTRNGAFGGEDLDFGYRARRAGLRIVFNPAAVSYQYYDIDARTYTRRSREAGRSFQELSFKHPEATAELEPRAQFATWRSRIALGALAISSPSVSWPVREVAIRLVSRSRPGLRSNRFFFAVQTMERMRGARQARRRAGSPLAIVLAYHALTELGADRILAEYGTPPERLAAQLDTLLRYGFRFIDHDSLIAALDGQRELPTRAVLVTFDDAYADLLSAGAPALAERGIPAVAFAVTDQIGGTNEWDHWLGATTLPLLDERGLRQIAAGGIAVGSHAATHRPLPRLTPAEVDEELRGSATALHAAGLPAPTVLSYPHGEWSQDVAAAVRKAGYRAAFTVTPGVVRRSANRYALPRIEVFASDTPKRLVLKLATARWPPRWRHLLLRMLRVKQ
jgi:peptidoglycan/xylan/chitin deacetylase (PgdA/CDA1 family)